jgi:antitoxin MazE
MLVVVCEYFKKVLPFQCKYIIITLKEEKMKINLVSIGNSKGIRIPANVLKQCNMTSGLELEVKKNRIILMPATEVPRKGWDKAFKEMHENKEDIQLLDEKVDMENWEWK